MLRLFVIPYFNKNRKKMETHKRSRRKQYSVADKAFSTAEDEAFVSDIYKILK